MYFFNVHATGIRLLLVMKCAAAAASAACLEVRLVAEWSNMIAPPPIHLCLSLSHILLCTLRLAHKHTHAHTHSLRKSCFIYETYSSESHRVLLRFRDRSHTHTHIHMQQGTHLPYLLFWLGRNAVVLAWPQPSSAALGWLPADARRMRRFGFECGRSSVEAVPSSECQRTRNAIPGLCESLRQHWWNVKRGNPTVGRTAKLSGLKMIKQCIRRRLTWWPPDKARCNLFFWYSCLRSEEKPELFFLVNNYKWPSNVWTEEETEDYSKSH